MSAQIIDGKQIALEVRAGVAEKVAALKAKGITPCLAVILVGENPASVLFMEFWFSCLCLSILMKIR